MEDQNFLDSTMDGQPYKAGHHAATLRRLLWREHLGLLPAQKLDASEDPNAQPPDVRPNDIMEGPEYEFVADPLSDQVWDMWTGNATRNTDIYRHLFRADPDDHSKPPPSLPSFLPSFLPLFFPPRSTKLNPDLLPTQNSKNIRRLPILHPKTRQVQTRPPPRPLHASTGSPAEARPDQGPFSLDAVGLLKGCRDGGEGLAGQCLHGEYLHLS